MTGLYKTILWMIEEDIFHLVLGYVMLDGEFFHDVWEPNEVVNIHWCYPFQRPLLPATFGYPGHEEHSWMNVSMKAISFLSQSLTTVSTSTPFLIATFWRKAATSGSR
jgi:hypothetical protein